MTILDFRHRGKYVSFTIDGIPPSNYMLKPYNATFYTCTYSSNNNVRAMVYLLKNHRIDTSNFMFTLLRTYYRTSSQIKSIIIDTLIDIKWNQRECVRTRLETNREKFESRTKHELTNDDCVVVINWDPFNFFLAKLYRELIVLCNRSKNPSYQQVALSRDMAILEKKMMDTLVNVCVKMIRALGPMAATSDEKYVGVDKIINILDYALKSHLDDRIIDCLMDLKFGPSVTICDAYSDAPKCESIPARSA